jgi:hypothetical protein
MAGKEVVYGRVGQWDNFTRNSYTPVYIWQITESIFSWIFTFCIILAGREFIVRSVFVAL